MPGQVIPIGRTYTPTAPGIYVFEQAPNETIISGVASDVIIIVGTAAGGPKNAPTPFSDITGYIRNFGNPGSNKFDMGRHVYAATLQGASNLYGIRVTDGTDVAASASILDTTTPTPLMGMKIVDKYTGTLGNNIRVSIQAGSNSIPTALTYRIVISYPGQESEVFENIAGTGAALWQNLADAINLGQNNIRGPSNLVVASIGTISTAPALGNYTLSGGTDGAAGVTATDLIGEDTLSRTGMYASRGINGILVLADVDDNETFATQIAFAESNTNYVMLTGPSGETVAEAIQVRKNGGFDSNAFKQMVGDYIYFYNPYSGQQELISPQGWIAGRLATLNPEVSSLNKPITGIVATQTTAARKVYTANDESSDIGQAVLNCLDLIYSPSPGGNYFSAQTGRCGSSNPLINEDQGNRLTNYLGLSIVAACGGFIGENQTPNVRRRARNAIVSLLQPLASAGRIGATNGGPAYQVTLDNSNNPLNRIYQGIMQADVKVANFRTIIYFLVNLQNGYLTLTTNFTAAA